MGLFKDIDDAIEEIEEASALLDLALQAEQENAEAYLRDFRTEIAQTGDIGVVRSRLAREQADAQNEGHLDVWREVSRCCARMAAVRLQELQQAEDTRRHRATAEATQRRQQEEARVARLQQEAAAAERRRIEADRATQAAIRARRKPERMVPPSPPRTPMTAQTSLPGQRVMASGARPSSPSASATPKTPTPMTNARAAVANDRPTKAPLTGLDLRRWRERAALSQRQAAERLGVAHGTVGKAEAVASALLPPSLQEALARTLHP